MSKFTSRFASVIEDMLEYHTALGFSSNTLNKNFSRFDRFCTEKYPDCDTLTKELVFDWLATCAEKLNNMVSHDVSSIRQLAEYFNAVGCEAYVLPYGFYPANKHFTPYIFTDSELFALFRAIDTLTTKCDRTESTVAPVLFRLIYTCGLRPNEGRELLRENVNLETGEIYVTNTKKKRERIVVMSSDMIKICNGYVRRNFLKSVYFFPRSDGNAYTSTQLDRLFKRCWIDANPGVTDLPNVRIYDLRHRYASARLNRWLDEGRDLNAMLPYLRTHMGHNELSDTAYYIHLLPENLVKSAGVD